MSISVNHLEGDTGPDRSGADTAQTLYQGNVLDDLWKPCLEKGVVANQRLSRNSGSLRNIKPHGNTNGALCQKGKHGQKRIWWRGRGNTQRGHSTWLLAWSPTPWQMWELLRIRWEFDCPQLIGARWHAQTIHTTHVSVQSFTKYSSQVLFPCYRRNNYAVFCWMSIFKLGFLPSFPLSLCVFLWANTVCRPD